MDKKKVLIVGYLITIVLMTLFFSPFTVTKVSNAGQRINFGEVRFQSYFNDGYKSLDDEGNWADAYSLDIERYKLQFAFITVLFAGIYIVIKESAD